MTGTTLGPYRITDKLGEGGMGAVYRARDTKLNRDVALKVLPELVAGDPDRLARFRREAQVLASLNHPNIAHLYGFEDADSSHALVMELVEGPTLADRILAGAIDWRDAVPIARQLADALEVAHEQGIVHRDLKPANIKVRDDGTVKVLDFGLAKALGPEGGDSASSASNSPTLTARATQMGMILGTAAYMAPEQARGRPVDRRADIWAFGVVLYEMLAGRRAFEGEDISITLASVLKEDVDWTALPSDLHPVLRRLLRRCLEKDPRKRLSAIGDARLELDEAIATPAGSDAAAPGTDASALALEALRSRLRRAWIAAGASTVVLVAAVVGLWLRDEQPSPPDRMEFAVTPAVEATSAGQLQPWISPDGRMVAYLGPSQVGGGPAIWIRRLDAVEPRMLAELEIGVTGFWSTDSRSLVYASRGQLYRVDVDGGPPQPLSAVTDFNGAAWLSPDEIVVATSTLTEGRLLRIAGQGGPPVEIAHPDGPDPVNCRWPTPLPDGNRILCLGWSLEAENRAVYAVSLDGEEAVRLVSSETQAYYAPPGFLLFVRGSTLFAQSFDPHALEMTGEPVRVADDVLVNRVTGRAAFSVSATGILTYRVGGAATARANLVWFDRSGRPLGTVGDERNYYQIRLSPDGKRVAIADAAAGSIDWRLSVLDLGNNVSSALTDEKLGANDPVWSPDGETIAFEAVRSGRQFFTQRVGSADATLVFESSENTKWVDDWSADGKFLLFHLPRPSKLFALPLDEPRTPILLIETTETIDGGHFSPDGQWVAYQMSESGGQYQVWVASFPAFDRRRRVSPQGGGQAFWRGDGRELFYMTPRGVLMSVQVSRNASGALDFAAPVELFQSPLTNPTLSIDQYSVTKDGQRFLFIRPIEATGAIPPITVVVNWAADLPR